MSRFPTTRWSLIHIASGKTADALQAREELCKLYLRPVRVLAQWIARAPHDAWDLVQDALAVFANPDELARVDRRHGKFRKWLSAVVRNRALNKRRDARAEKRGGGAVSLSFDVCAAEDCHALEPVASRTPEDVFARCQVTQIVQQVLGELEQHYASLGKHEHFQRLKVWMDGRQAPYGVLSAEFGISAGTLRKQMFEMRLHFKSILFRHLKRRGVKSADIEDEIRGLIAALS